MKRHPTGAPRSAQRAPRSRPPRVLFVEDQPRFAQAFLREAARDARGRLEFLWAASAEEALRRAAADPCELGLIDLGLGNASGLEVIAALARGGTMRLVAFTVFDDAATVRAAVAAGASGYLLKEEPLEHIVRVLLECLEGGVPLSSHAARHLVAPGSGSPAKPPEDRPESDSLSLTPREYDVLDALSRGLTYTECAASLGMQVGTVQTHVKSLYRKLDVTTKAEAAAWLARHAQRRG